MTLNLVGRTFAALLLAAPLLVTARAHAQSLEQPAAVSDHPSRNSPKTQTEAAYSVPPDEDDPYHCANYCSSTTPCTATCNEYLGQTTCGDYGICKPSTPSWVPSSSPYPFYAVGSGAGDNSSDVYSFNYQNNAITNFRKIGEAGRILFDIANAGGSLYGVDAAGRLYSIRTTDGYAVLLGGGSYAVNALDFCGSTLYGWAGDKLVTLNTSNGAATLVGTTTGYQSSGDLACWWDSSTGWWKMNGTAVGSSTNLLVSINPSSGASSLIGTTTRNSLFGLDTDQSNVLFGANSSSSTLYLYVFQPGTSTSWMVATYPTGAGMNGLAAYYTIPY